MVDTSVSKAVGIFDFSGLLGGAGVIIGLLLLAIMFIGGVIMILVWYFNEKRFTHRVLIFYKQKYSNTPLLKFDKGGVFFKKKENQKRFWLKKNRTSLEADGVPFIIGEKGKKMVLIRQDDFATYKFVMPTFTETGKILFRVGEEDVNWAVGVFDAVKQLTQGKKNWLQEYAPLIIWFFVILSITVLLFVIFDKMESILPQFATTMENAAKILQTIDVTQGGSIIE